MKKCVISFSALITAISSSLFAEPVVLAKPAPVYGAQQGQTATPDCSQLNQAEQNFAAQIMDINNRAMFCSQFSIQERQQAMQMMGQPDSSGNLMNADQAVQQVMGSGSMPMSQQKPRSSGGCPVK
jgi:hypothetical protein